MTKGDVKAFVILISHPARHKIVHEQQDIHVLNRVSNLTESVLDFITKIKPIMIQYCKCFALIKSLARAVLFERPRSMQQYFKGTGRFPFLSQRKIRQFASIYFFYPRFRITRISGFPTDT